MSEDRLEKALQEMRQEDVDAGTVMQHSVLMTQNSELK